MDDDVIRLRLDLAYDGSDFSGWASQPGRRTVQGVLEEALGRVLRLSGPARLTVAGRTDAGVHAEGQTAHVDVPRSGWAAAPPGRLLWSLAGVLPPDVRVRALAPAPPGFDARFSALWRRYRYRVCDFPAGADPLRRHDTLWHPRPLRVDRMNAAAGPLLGEHDFAAFCRRREGATTVRRLLRLDWARDRAAGWSEEPGVAVATVVADAFCHHMVRAMVGALIAVGEDRRELGWPRQLLSAAVRDGAVHVAPAHGLCLAEVRYPPPAELAARAAETRRVRS
ncbi:MAG TPA: tRNA pseudouridine(38-40) synthase TruA [Streptosporangiaceae bacterium]